MVPMESVHSEGVPFGVTTHRCQKSQMREFQAHEKFISRSRNLFDPTYRKIRRIQMCDYLSDPSKMRAIYRQKTGDFRTHGRLELTLVVNASASLSLSLSLVMTQCFNFRCSIDGEDCSGRTGGI